MEHDYIKLFKELLISNNQKISNLTLINYLSDLRHFIKWFEKVVGIKFAPNKVSRDIITLYHKARGGMIENRTLDQSSQLSEISIKRHISSLRKFFDLAITKDNSISNPFQNDKSRISEKKKAFWKIHDFKNELLRNSSSYLTVKNYLSDITNFTRWFEKNLEKGEFEQNSSTPSIPVKISQNTIDKYKNSLTVEYNASPKTVNRKLSSLRRYIKFGEKLSFLIVEDIQIINLKIK